MYMEKDSSEDFRGYKCEFLYSKYDKNTKKIYIGLQFWFLKLHGIRDICDWMEPLGEKDLDLRCQECDLNRGSSA